MVGTRSSGQAPGHRMSWTGCGVWVVVVAWEAIFFWELQFEWLTGVKRALERQLVRGVWGSVCPGLQAPRGGAKKEEEPKRGEGRGPALPPGKRGYGQREKRAQGPPRCCQRSGQRGAQKGPNGASPPSSLPARQTPMPRSLFHRLSCYKLSPVLFGKTVLFISKVIL